MPDAMPTIVLPGIDPAQNTPTAPAAGEAPAAPTETSSPAEDTSTQSASVDTGVGETTTPPGDTTPQPPTETPKGVQKRIGELLTRERVATERADRLEALVTQMVTGMMSPEKARAAAGADASGAADPKPNESQYADWPSFNAATVQWEARQAVRAEFNRVAEAQTKERAEYQQLSQRQAAAEAEHQLHSFVSTGMQEAAERIPGFREAMQEAHFQVPLNVEAAVALSGAVGEVSLYLAKNPQLVPQLARLPDMAIMLHVSRIAHAMKNGSATLSNAPAPGRPGGSRGSTSPLEYPKDATPQQHLEWEKRMAKQRAGSAH